MSELRFFYQLFQYEPDTWGYRGDPYLWEDMRLLAFSKALLVPSDEIGVRQEVTMLFNELTGHDLNNSEPFVIDRYAHGGQSSGYIGTNFWREKAIPFLWSIAAGRGPIRT